MLSAVSVHGDKVQIMLDIIQFNFVPKASRCDAAYQSTTLAIYNFSSDRLVIDKTYCNLAVYSKPKMAKQFETTDMILDMYFQQIQHYFVTNPNSIKSSDFFLAGARRTHLQLRLTQEHQTELQPLAHSTNCACQWQPSQSFGFPVSNYTITLFFYKPQFSTLQRSYQQGFDSTRDS